MNAVKNPYYSFIFFLLGALGLFVSCSQESNSKVSKGYHNMTARYNAYFLARERIKEIEVKVWNDRKDDYNLILPVYHFVDSTFSASLKEDVEYVVERATYPIKLHKNSNWVDDSYILIGKARKYNGQMEYAIKTFKYVNTKGKDPNAKHEAVIQLVQCHLKEENYPAARKVLVYLNNQEFSEENERDYHLTAAEYYRRTEDYNEMLVHVEKAIPLLKQKKWKYRMYFIAGQLRQQNGNDSLAFAHYQQVLKRNPPYELEFHTKLNMAQVYPVENNKDIKKINKYFAKFLKDEKNLEYKDIILYEQGMFEYRLGHREKALDLLHQSVHVSGARPLQQAYAYRAQGDIFYDREDLPRLTKYRTSKEFYDSTVNVMTSQISKYDETITRQDVLTRFVDELETVEREDSLQKLAKMDSTALVAYLEEIAANESQRLRDQAERERLLAEKQAKEAQNASSGGFNTNVGIQAGNNFVFYNARILSQSNANFKKRWGPRPLEDNWRRSSKQSVFNDDEENAPTNPDSIAIVVNPDSLRADSLRLALEDSLAREESFKVDPNAYWKEIPRNQAALAESNVKIEEALFKLGKILTFELAEEDYAIEAFSKLNNDYPENKNYVETLYFLYLLCQKSPDCDANQYKAELMREYPYSIFAKIVENPNYLTDYQDENKQSAQAYEQAYALYQNGRYIETNKLLQNTIQKYPKAEVMDKMVFLEVLTRARMENFSGYIEGLKKFKETFRTSPLNDYADELLGQEEEIEKRGSLVVQEDYLYSPDDSVYYFVASFEKGIADENQAFKNILEYNQNRNREMDFRSRKIDFSETHFLVVVKEFNSLETAKTYSDKLTQYDAFRDYYSEDVVRNYYVISSNNFNVLLKKRDLQAFQAFYNKHY